MPSATNSGPAFTSRISGASHGMRVAKKPGSYMRRDDAVNAGRHGPCTNVRSTTISDSSSCWWFAISSVGPRRRGSRPNWRTRTRIVIKGSRNAHVSATSSVDQLDASGLCPTRSTTSEPIAKQRPALANSQR